MKEHTLQVSASLEARPAALFVQTASRYASEIHVRLDNKTVNAKSIMGMISIGILDGQTIALIANGPDESAAIEELSKFFVSI